MNLPFFYTQHPQNALTPKMNISSSMSWASLDQVGASQSSLLMYLLTKTLSQAAKDAGNDNHVRAKETLLALVKHSWHSAWGSGVRLAHLSPPTVVEVGVLKAMS